MDKYLLMFGIGAAIIIFGIVTYPQILNYQNTQIQSSQEYIIKKINALNENRTMQFLVLQKEIESGQNAYLLQQGINLQNKTIQLITNNTQALADLVLGNQELMKKALRIINATTAINLKNTFINKQNIEAIHNDTITLVKALNASLIAHALQDTQRFQNLSLSGSHTRH